MGHKAQGGFTLHNIYCVLFRSLHRHEDLVQSSGGSVKLGW